MVEIVDLVDPDRVPVLTLVAYVIDVANELVDQDDVADLLIALAAAIAEGL